MLHILLQPAIDFGKAALRSAAWLAGTIAVFMAIWCGSYFIVSCATAFPLWRNDTQMTFVIDAILALSDTDNTDCTIKETDGSVDFTTTTTVPAIPEKTINVLVLGDSWACPEHFPQDVPGWNVTSFSRRGATIDEIYDTIPFIWAGEYDRVIVFAGLNDYLLHGATIEEIELGQQRIAARLQELYGITPEIVPIKCVLRMRNTAYVMPNARNHIIPDGYRLLFALSGIDYPVPPYPGDLEIYPSCECD